MPRTGAPGDGLRRGKKIATPGGGQPFRVPLIGCRETRHQPHRPLIGSEVPVDIVAEVPLTGLSLMVLAYLHYVKWPPVAALYSATVVRQSIFDPESPTLVDTSPCRQSETARYHFLACPRLHSCRLLHCQH